jgi:serine/threonine protein kinase
MPTVPAERAAPRSPEAGDIIAGKYHLVRPIGLGAMGLVFEATHLRMQQRVAIKFMQSKLVGQPEPVARFEREGRAASRLTSPHATRIFDVDTTPEGVPYIVSELLEGQDLRGELDERDRLPIEEAVTYIIQACAVMAEAHSFGIVHRDLKPSNLFLAKTSAGRAIKVLDFGISKMEEELELTTTGILIGSPRYMSPEQVEGRRVDRRADIWSLGVILFRAISGAYPFEGNTSISLAMAILNQPPRDLVSLVPEAPPGLVSAIKKALTPDLASRYATAHDFAEALAPFASLEAAALASSITSEIPPSETSKPTLELRKLGVDTRIDGQAELDALIDISFEPPEQATASGTRGTWTQPSSRPKFPPSDRRNPLVLRAAWFVGAIAVCSIVAFELAQHRGGAHELAGVSTAPSPPVPTNTPASVPAASTSPAAVDAVTATVPAATPPAAAPTPSSRPKSPTWGRPGPRNPATAGPNTPPTQAQKNPTYL